MKTPEEVAREFIGEDALAGIGYERDLEVAAAAIAYDRRHRLVAPPLPAVTDPGHVLDPTVTSLSFDLDDVVMIAEPVELDNVDDLEPVDPEDYRPLIDVGEMQEFSDIQVWCDFANEWAYTHRPGPDGPWFCFNCGATDHAPRDHEGEGA